jgi:hypothetical protein
VNCVCADVFCEVPHFSSIPTPTANVITDAEATTITTSTGCVSSLNYGWDCNEAPCQCVTSTDTHHSSVRLAVCSRLFSSATATLSSVHLGDQGSWKDIKSVHNHSITSKERGRAVIPFRNSPGRGKRPTLLHSVQTGSGVHPISYKIDIGGSFPGGIKQPAREADHSPQFCSEVKNDRIIH